ncbi:MAG: hypothetical protein GY938_02465 [Ketobacter sp.]|nr:hypothetical protein [Ketobacter sp.]
MLTVSQWSDAERFLSSESAAEAGKWHNDRAPHTIAPMDALSPLDPCQVVILKWSAQSAKTEVVNNFAGYIIDQDPGSVLVVQPNERPMGETWSKDRLAPMIRDTPALAKKVVAGKGRDSENTILRKKFPGGQLTVAGASSPSQLASRPIRYLLCDEIDRWPTTKEGSPLQLAIKRTQAFWNRKILMVSTPTFEGVGIDSEYENCLQHEWHLKCSHCSAYQMPKFKHFTFDRDQSNGPTNIRYCCEVCGSEHTEGEQFKIKNTGKWVQTNEASPMRKGYWMNQFASPFATWTETIAEFLLAKKDPLKLQVAINTVFAETWKGMGISLDWEILRQRREVYPINKSDRLVPAGVQLLTLVVDTQDTWLDCEVVGSNA